mgnify:CR=1 FL=1
MKKTMFLTALLAAASITGFAYNVYAPNSFDAVSPASWDYKTVETLCREGKAPSYTEDFFRRGSMTRYELASVIKDMLEHHDRNDKDHGSLMKLKKEYARELEALGYREEKKTAEGKPVLEMGGDGRIRYSSDGDADGRVRINTRWHIDRDTTVNAGGTKNVDLAGWRLIYCYAFRDLSNRKQAP